MRELLSHGSNAHLARVLATKLTTVAQIVCLVPAGGVSRSGGEGGGETERGGGGSGEREGGGSGGVGGGGGGEGEGGGGVLRSEEEGEGGGSGGGDRVDGLVVVNTHLFFHPGAAHIRMLQVHAMPGRLWPYDTSV